MPIVVLYRLEGEGYLIPKAGTFSVNEEHWSLGPALGKAVSSEKSQTRSIPLV